MPRGAIILMGLRAAGKSTVGAVVARRAGLLLVEIDDRAARRMNAPDAATAIRRDGLPAFREAEAACLEAALTEQGGSVICLGGGTPTAPGAADQLRAACPPARLVYLRATPATLRRRLESTDLSTRPSLTGKHPLEEIGAVFAERDPLYLALADTVIDIDDLGVDEVVGRVIAIAE